MNERKHRPQMIAERKPVRPVHVAVARQPVKVTKPISLSGGDLIAAVTTPMRRVR